MIFCEKPTNRTRSEFAQHYSLQLSPTGSTENPPEGRCLRDNKKAS